jgi:hypothetical protein
MRRLAAVALAGAALLACRGRGVVGPAAPDAAAHEGETHEGETDGGATDAVADAADDVLGDATTLETAAASARAYDVTATLVVTPAVADVGSWAQFPRTETFTLEWDPTAGRVVASAGGPVAYGAVTTTDGQTFHVAGPFSLPVPFDQSCGGLGSIEYDALMFSLAGTATGGTLRGAGQGIARYQEGDEILSAPVTVTFTSVAHTAPPALELPAAPVDPLVGFTIPISEPVSSDATADLVGATDGDDVPLNSTYVDVTGHAIGGFAKRNVMLHYGETYVVQTMGFADLAGNAPSASAPPPAITMGPAPPLVPQDGFESVTTTMFGGAGVLRGGPLTPISGTTSLLLNTGFGGGFGFLPYDLGSSLAVRLAVKPTDTVLKFDGQLIAPDPVDEAAFMGALLIGSPDEPVTSSMNVAGTSFARVTLPGNGDVFVSPVQTIALPLPPVSNGEVTFEIVGVTFACGLPPSPTVLVVDNLRAE